MTIGYILTWDGISSSSVPEMVNQKISRNLVGSVRNQLVEVPGRDGAYLFEERRGNRTVRVDGTLVADSPTVLRTAVVDMAEWLDRTGYRKLIISDQPDRYWMAALASDPSPDDWKRMSKYSLEWTAEPYAYALTTSEECQVTALNASDYAFIIPDTVDAYPVVEITARGGDIQNLTLTVVGESLTYSGTINQNATLTISSINFTVYEGVNADLELTGAWTPGTVFPADVTGTFPILYEGNNAWNLSWTGGTATYAEVCFTWRRRYR